MGKKRKISSTKPIKLTFLNFTVRIIKINDKESLMLLKGCVLLFASLLLSVVLPVVARVFSCIALVLFILITGGICLYGEFISNGSKNIKKKSPKWTSVQPTQ